MALQLRKFLIAAAGSLFAAVMIGSLHTAAAEAEDDTILLNRFVVDENGTRIITDSVFSDSIAESGWYVDDVGSLYYFYDDSTYATEKTTLDDGNTYLFASDGTLKTGWQTVDGKRCYYNTETGKPVSGWFPYLDYLYYIDETAGKLTGVQEIDGIPYTFDEFGSVQTGYITYEDGSLYYYDEDAVPANGWMTTENGTYYFTTGGAATGITSIDGKNYAFGEDGLLQTGGWITVNDKKCYADETGILAAGLTEIDGQFYFFDTETNLMQKGLVVSDDGTRFFAEDENAVMQTGWVTVEETKCYFSSETGLLATGIQTIDGVLYQLDETGAIQTGWASVDGKQLYFTENGAASGLTVIDGKTYFFSSADNTMQTGWQSLEGKNYFFDTETGVMQTGWLTTDAGKCYLTENGMASGLTVIDGNTYYFQPETGVLQTGWIIVDGISHLFDETTGIMTSTVGHAAIQLDVPDYKQFDEQWGNKKITYSTIGKVGCLVTAIAMKYSTDTGVETTPDKMVSKLSFSGDSLLWNSCTNLGYTVENASGSMTQTVMQKIYDQLTYGTPVIIGAKKSSGGQHYIVVTGYTGSEGTAFSASNFVIHDPGSSKRFRLDEYLALYPYLYKIIY